MCIDDDAAPPLLPPVWQKLRNELEEEQHETSRLNELLAHQSRVIEEQKHSISDKEKQILNLRAGNRTLDNFRFVLDHRINQLTKERGPITAHVNELEKHINEMYDELVREFQEKKAADREMSNKDLKIEVRFGLVTWSHGTHSHTHSRTNTPLRRRASPTKPPSCAPLCVRRSAPLPACRPTLSAT